MQLDKIKNPFLKRNLLSPTVQASDAATPHFQLRSDGTLAGNQAVSAMQAVCEGDYATLKSWYGGRDIPGLPSIVTVDINAGGAYHQTCADTGIHVIPEDAPSLLVAELIECFQALDGNYNCGQTDGEGLSRAAAMTIRPFKVLSGLDGDVAGWWNGGNPRDFVNDNSQDDQNQQANACGTLFIFWLRYKGYGWDKIVAAQGPTLGDKYHSLSGDTPQNGFSEFVASLKALSVDPASIDGNPFPAGQPIPTPVSAPVGSGCLMVPFMFVYGIWRTIVG